jgi:DNA repair protein RadC
MYLNRANHLLGVYKASIGGISGTVADVRLILGVALKAASTSIILAHNHPSGNLKPSTQDETLTHKILEGGKLLEIRLIDHLIINSQAFYSFADEGVLNVVN